MKPVHLRLLNIKSLRLTGMLFSNIWRIKLKS